MARMGINGDEVQEKSIGVAMEKSQTVYLKAFGFCYLPLLSLPLLNQRRVGDTGRDFVFPFFLLRSDVAFESHVHWQREKNIHVLKKKHVNNFDNEHHI